MPETITVVRWKLEGAGHIEIEGGKAWVFTTRYMNEAELRNLVEVATQVADHLGKQKP